MIIFLYGADMFRAKEKLNELKGRFLEKNNGNSSPGCGLGQVLVSLIDGAEFNLAEFRNKVLSVGFFAEKKMILLKVQGLAFKNQESEILGIIKKIPEETILIVWDNSDDEKFLKSDLGKFLLKQKYVFEFNPLSGNALAAWIKERVALYGREIDNEAIVEICDILGSDLWKIDLELVKICAYASSLCHSEGVMVTEESKSRDASVAGTPSQDARQKNIIITKKIVGDMLSKEAEDNIFKFVDALATKNKRLASLAFEEELRAGAPELQILGAVSGQVRNLIQVKLLLEKNPYNKNDLAKKLNIHPYVAQKSLAQANNFHINELKNIYRQLLAIDIGIKTSSGSAKALFSRMIAKM